MSDLTRSLPIVDIRRMKEIIQIAVVIIIQYLIILSYFVELDLWRWSPMTPPDVYAYEEDTKRWIKPKTITRLEQYQRLSR